MTRFLLAAAFVLFTSFAAAEERTITASSEIEFERSKLNDAEYVAALYDAIEHVAKMNCIELYAKENTSFKRIESCTKEAVMKAVANIDAPLLTALADRPCGVRP